MTTSVTTDLVPAGAGGGGCFRRGTQIQLQHGKTIAIEALSIGDEILAFDEDGNLHPAKVEKIHIHEKPEHIFRVKFWRGEVFITLNHWVLNQYCSFVEIGTLSIEDALVDGMGHLRPIISTEYVGKEPVYNLTVEKYHTFIANNIRVHNGGHRETYPVIAGAMGGGGKGGGGRAAQEDPESLQSRTMVSILDLLGEGQIGGLLNGAQSIFFNDTPLQNSDGSYNFNGVTWDARYGTPNQGYIPGYADVESPFNVNVQCKTTTPVTFTVTNPNADRVRAIVSIPSLTSTDITTGDLHGTSVTYKFQVSANGGAYQDVVVDYVWGTATIGTNGGYPSVTADGPSATHVACTIRLDATGTVSYKDFTWSASAVIQPQTWTGSAWVNYGPTVTIQAEPNTSSWVGRFTTLFSTQKSQVTKDAYVDLPSSAARFVVVSITSGATISLLDAKAYQGTANVLVSGKTRSRYQRSHLITLPKPATTWNIRMVRITADSTSSALTNDTYLDSYVEIVDTKIGYVNSAVVGVTIDSALFNKIPSRSYLVNGLYVRVPTNYDSTSRTYTGSWNGTFKVAVSNGNPAWILFDLLTNPRYGLGLYLGESGQNVDKASLYAIGKYCDELVFDGFNGTEPRFVINTVIQSPAEAYKLISDIASAFQGMCYWAGGLASFTQDAPTDAGMIYGRANVVDGIFNYSGSARKDRHSVIHVTWNDPLDNYKQKIEYIEDSSLVAKYGIRKYETVAFGCTSRGQANRVGRWILYTEQYQSALITFGVGLDSALVLPGEVIQINDPTRAGKRMAGRLMGITANSATLDAPTAFGAGAEISLMLPDGTFVDRPLLQSAGTYTTVTWTTALATLPLLNSMFMISETALVPLQARVVSIAQDESNKDQYVITAVEHNPSKYGAIENGWSLTKPVTSILKSKPDMPTSLVLVDILYQSGANYASKLHASWDSTHGDVKGWYVRLLGPSNIWQDFGLITVASLEIPNVIDGQNYTIEVKAVNVLGIQSDPAIVSRTVLGKDRAPSNVTGAAAIETDNGVKISWVTVSDIDLAYYEIREGTVWGTATFVATVNNNFIDLPQQTQGLHTWLIRARDTTDHYSEVDAVVTLNVGVPATPTVVAAFVGSTIEVGWSVVAIADSYFVEVVESGIVRRSFVTTMNHFSYTLEAATADGGPWRSVTVRVYAKKGNLMGSAGIVTSDVNAPPPSPTMILVPAIKAVSITVSKCPDLDYAGTLIHASQTAGFTPSDANKIFDGDANFFMHTDVTGTWYYRAAHYDDFGKSGLNYSSEVSALPTAGVAGITTVTALPANPAAVSGQLAIFLDVSDTTIRGLYGWDGTKWVKTSELLDGSITFEKFDPNLIFSTEIEDGEINARHIADGAVAYEKLDPALAFEVEVEAGEITTTHIADDAISTPKLMAGAVIASKIAANNITTNHLQADSVTSLKIAANQILANHILANQIQASHIAASQITTNHLLAGAVTAAKMTVTDLSAITANMGAITSGSITLDAAGFIKGGQTAYNTGTGFWLGYNITDYRFSLGSSSGNSITWDGTTINVIGNLNLGNTNFLSAGQTGYNTGIGFWLGFNGGKYKFSVGNPAGKALLWDGATLTIQGDVIATGNINANAVTATAVAYAASVVDATNNAWQSMQFLSFNKVSTGPVVIRTYLNIDDSASKRGTSVRFLRDGLEIYRIDGFTAQGGGGLFGGSNIPYAKRTWIYEYVDTGAAGTHSYDLQLFVTEVSGQPNCKVDIRSIVVTEMKR